MVQKIKDGYKPHTDQCKDTEGNIIGDKEQIEGRWKEHFKEILNENKHNSKTTALDIEQYPMNTQIGEMGIQAPTGQETQLALQKLNSNNAVGIDGIPAELKHRREEVINKIHKLVGIMWEKERIPKEWKLHIICPIHKKWDKLNCQKYRNISLLCTASNTFTTMLKNKLEPYAEKVIGEYQLGFRPGQSTIDQISTVQQTLEKCWECNISVYLAFINFRQAYDSVGREEIYVALQYFPIPSTLIRLVKATMHNMVAKVQVQTEMTVLFEVRDGLKQGDGLEPLLFNVIMECVLRKIQVIETQHNSIN